MKTRMTGLALAGVLLLTAGVQAQESTAYPSSTEQVQDAESPNGYRDRRDRRDDRGGAYGGVFDRQREVQAIEGRNSERVDAQHKWTAADIRSGDPTGGSDLSPSTGDPNDNITWGPNPQGFDSQKTFTPR